MIERPRAVAAPSSLPGAGEILTDEALGFLAELHQRFDARRRELLAARIERQKRFDAGRTAGLSRRKRATSAKPIGRSAPIPADLLDRRVEITGPTNAKMVINALNSGAKVFMADFEDATSPVWDELVQGQINLRNRWLGKLDFTDPDSGKHYALGANPAVLMVRPRGWHLPERHVTVDGEPIAGALVDFGLYLCSTAPALALDAGSGPYFYLPKLESRHEAALWSDVFAYRRGAARPRARHDQGDGADRDAARRVRDGRDPPRAARQYRRPQLRPLGLYLQLHQAARPLARPADPRPLGDDHG